MTMNTANALAAIEKAFRHLERWEYLVTVGEAHGDPIQIQARAREDAIRDLNAAITEYSRTIQNELIRRPLGVPKGQEDRAK